MNSEPTKQKITRIASSLFYQKGFRGTSVRDIAKEADVNLSAISYYFKGKQGLLEHTVTSYFEDYLAVLEAAFFKTRNLPAVERLKKLIRTIIQFKQEYEQLSCFIYRELAFDSIFVREMVVTYLAKESFYIKKIFYTILEEKSISKKEHPFLFMQLLGMFSTPYLLHSELKSQAIGVTGKDYFTENYVSVIYKWIDSVIEA